MSGPTYASQEQTLNQPNPIDIEKHALMFGSKNAPGRVALKEISRQQRLTTDYLNQVPGAAEKYWGKFLAPQKTGKTQTAAQGGLMALRGYATGGTAINAEQEAFIKQMSKLMADGKELTQTQKDRLNRIEEKTGRNVSPYTDVGTKTPANASIAKAAEQIQSSYAKTNPSTPADAEPSPYSNIIPDVYQNIPQGAANTFVKAGVDPTKFGDKYGGMTNPLAQQTFDYLQDMKMPDEYGQASDMYRTAGAGLEKMAGYTPEQVAYNNAAAERASAQQGSAQQATAAQMGQIANVSAERAAAERAAASQMGQIADINAQRAQTRGYDAALMNAPERVAASDYEAAQMQKAGDVSTKDLTAYQMEGPGAWIDEGMAQKYMNPYIQGVVDISKREAERDYLKQQNALNAKAMSAGAFGGARQALERSEAQRNYNEQLQDIQTRGLSDAYTQGRSQYSTDTAAQQAARIQNLQSQLGTQSQSSQQALQSALANQSVEMQTAQQNMAALNNQRQSFVNQQLQAAINNYGGELTAEQANQVAQNAAAQFYSSAENQSALQYATQALQAAQANQQTQFGVGSLNANLAQQASLRNAELGTQTNLANQQAALQAALANQQTQFGVGSLNANLANQVGLQNASLGTQASLTNAQLGTQAALQNAQLGTQTNLANAQNALQAGMANQQAGLQGNQQNIAAYGAMGNMAGGLGAIGGNRAAWDQQRLTNLAQGAETQMNNEQQWYDSYQKTADKTYNAPAQGGITAGQVVGPMTGTSGGSTTYKS